MSASWTGGQWSVVRFAFGAYLALLFARMVPFAAELFSHAGAIPDASALPRRFPNALLVFDAPWFATALTSLAAAVSLLVAVGWRTRSAALLLWYLVACFTGRNPFLADSGLPVFGWLLLLQLFVPPAPFASMDARGRADPAGPWFLPRAIPVATRLLLLGHLAAAWIHGRPLDPGRGGVAGFLFAALFAFDPRWIPARKPAGAETLFYDGRCGLCHRAVRFAIAEARYPEALRFSPIGGEAFRAAIPPARDLPDSVLLDLGGGRLEVRSSAVVHLLRRCGGYWRALGELLRLVPRPLRDALYDGVARVRHRLFPRPEGGCPILPPETRARFLA